MPRRRTRRRAIPNAIGSRKRKSSRTPQSKRRTSISRWESFRTRITPRSATSTRRAPWRPWPHSSATDDGFPLRPPLVMADGVSGLGEGRVVHAENVGKAFGRSVVLRDLTLSVTAGETVAIFGPNGAGKSTMLRLLAGLTTPTGGSLRLLAMDPASAAVRGRIGLVAHQSFLYPDLTARENLLFYARMYGLDDAAARAETWLERVALVDVGDRPVRLFSRGMEQRLALARALL